VAPGTGMPEIPFSARKQIKKSVGGVRVQGEADIVVRFAKCCTPVAGDSIIAFISRGRGVIVHTRECPKALDLDPARRVEVSWDEGVHTLRPVAVEVLSTDRPGILASISKCFTEHGVNISQAKCKTTEDRRGINTFQVTVGHLDQLKTVIRAIQGLDGVVSVSRL
jgi:guanosine-3',5'-bis(diphosphate) 3'-pyrophosphohydrolase